VSRSRGLVPGATARREFLLACNQLGAVTPFPPCLPLGQFVAQSKGSLRSPVRVRCSDFGERGTLKVR